MSLKVHVNSVELDPIPEDTYYGICYSVVDIGLQYNQAFKKTSAKIILTWEIVDDDLRRDFGRGKLERRSISKQYTASLNNKSNLYGDIRPWLGREPEGDTLDLSQLAGQPCMLTIVNNEGSDGKVYSNVTGVGKVMKGVDLGKPENPIIIYDIDESDEELFAALPEWIQKKIRESKNPNSRSANSIAVTVDTETGEIAEGTPIAKRQPEPVNIYVDEDEATKIDDMPEEDDEDYPF
jgi:hypothetical protein